ncbi:MAG: hypothetical protein R6U95_05220 [Bacteroidales bacterium]
MKKACVYIVFGIISNWAVAQNETEFIVTDSVCNCDVFYLRDSVIHTHTYSFEKITNKEYVVLTNKIDSISALLNHSEKNLSLLNDSIQHIQTSYESKLLSEYDRKNLNTAQKHFNEALKQHNSSHVFNRNTNNILQYIRMGNDELQRTSISFAESNSDIYGIHIKNTKSNLIILDSLLQHNSALREEKNKKISTLGTSRDSISEIHTEHFREKSDLKHHIRINNITECVYEFMPGEKIERKILYIDTLTLAKLFPNTYTPLQESYSLINTTKHQFIKNEIILSDSLRVLLDKPSIQREISEYIASYSNQPTQGYIFKDMQTQQLFYTPCNFLSECAEEKKYHFAKTHIEAAGGNIYEEEGEIIIRYKNQKTIGTPIIIEHLAQNDISIISKMNSSVKQYKKLQKQAADKVETLMKFRNLYRAKLLTISDLNKWKEETNETLAILTKMKSLPFADLQEYHSHINYQNTCLYKTYEIIDITNECRRLLGL